MRRCVVLLGASGVFGGRIAARVASWPEVELVAAGRRAKPLEALRDRLIAAGAAAQLAVASVDGRRPAEILALAPWAVVDTAGPFQGADLTLARAVIDAGAHWIDLADARDFVAAFAPSLDALAKARGVFAVTGASSTPATTNAALDQLTAGWKRVDSAWVAISAGAQTPGLSVTRAILSWAGRPVRCFQGGAWTERAGWSGLKAVHVPGLGRRRVSLADTADLDILPRRASREGLFLAGVEPPLLQFLVWLAAWLVRLRILPSLLLFAELLRGLAIPLTRLGAPRGGMVVVAEGLGADGEPRIARWSLVAAGGDGPSVPTAPALAVLRRLVSGRLPADGATPCLKVVTLDEIMDELRGLRITTRREGWRPDPPGLFPGVLGDDFAGLPPVVRRVHSGDAVRLTGQALSFADRWPAALIAWIVGLPGRGRFRAQVEVSLDQQGEVWTRQFGPHRFVSRLRLAPRWGPGLFEERIGPLTFRFSATPDVRGFRWVREGWSLAGVPLPLWLGPRVRARSFERDGMYRFSVLVAHPWLGVLIAYAGRLQMTSA